jgi:hypothetical protein
LDGWEYVRAWASHRPSAWKNEDRRKRKGSAHQVPEFTANLARALSWSLTGDPFHFDIPLGTTELSHTLVDGICLTLIIGIVRHSGFAPAAALSFFLPIKVAIVLRDTFPAEYFLGGRLVSCLTSHIRSAFGRAA